MNRDHSTFPMHLLIKRKIRISKAVFLPLVLCLFFMPCGYGQINRELKEGFRNPPSDAWPRTWWHWTNSNVTKDGITKDLEWMKRSGIAGFQLADVAYGGGQTVSKKTVFGTAEWLEAVRHAATEAERLKLEMAVFTSAGWSLTGGSWVRPEQAMKKLVWSEQIAKGGVLFRGKLPLPPNSEGAGPGIFNKGLKPGPYYVDCESCVLATQLREQRTGRQFRRP